MTGIMTMCHRQQSDATGVPEMDVVTPHDGLAEQRRMVERTELTLSFFRLTPPKNLRLSDEACDSRGHYRL